MPRTARRWVADGQMPSFECTSWPLEREDDGELVATLVRKRVDAIGEPGGPPRAGRTAFLYLHGFVDYWFHDHVAVGLLDAGIDFYALEMRRAGRSLRAGNRPNYCTAVTEYFPEISAAIDVIMQEDAHTDVVLYGHSTGGLVAALYADRGERRTSLSAVVLNSPFFGFKVNGLQKFKLPIAVTVGGTFPTLNDKHAISPMYGEGLHVSRRGEWNYYLAWKPIDGFPAYFGWVRAIKHGHDGVRAGLAIACPVLVLHSDKSDGGSTWSDAFMSADIVLDVAHMRAYSGGLGTRVTRTEIPDAIHDVMLSRPPVRERALATMLQWLSTNAASA
jgi:alpha-beta hydrolase superfamily lysophospholipase